MRPLFLTATTIVSALGRGHAATLAALREGRSGLVPCDFPHAPTRGHIGRVAGLDEWRLESRYDCRNNALADMALRTDGFLDAVAAARARYGAGRVATVIGTSTSGILATEQAYRSRDARTGALPAAFDYDCSHDLSALSAYVRETLELSGPAMTVSVACASSARAFIDARHLIEAGFADAAVVGGSDSLCGLTLHGFASLDVVAEGRCRPCDAARDGISIGEASGFSLLERQGSGVALLGAGASSDGHHMSTPRPDGAGAARAMREALAQAGVPAAEVDYVNLHGTGTRANDAMEDRAVVSVLGGAVPCSSTKGYSGHTMGSCGILEAVIAKLCIEAGFMPGGLGISQADPAFGMNVLSASRQGPLSRVLSNSFGFGGVNCALLLGAV